MTAEIKLGTLTLDKVAAKAILGDTESMLTRIAQRSDETVQRLQVFSRAYTSAATNTAGTAQAIARAEALMAQAMADTGNSAAAKAALVDRFARQYIGSAATEAKAAELAAAGHTKAAEAMRFYIATAAAAPAAVDKFGTAAATATGHSTRFGGAMQQVGYQMTDVVTQISMGGNAATALGVQMGQLLGSFGTWGAVAGLAAVSAGALYNVLSDGKAATEAAEAAAKSYADSLAELTEVEKAYTAALRERQGLSPLDTSTDAIEKRVREAEGRLRGLSDKSLSGPASLWDRISGFATGDTDSKKQAEAMADLEDARRNLGIANDLAEARDKESLIKILDDLHKARLDDLNVIRMATDASKEQGAALEAERAIREKLKDTGAGASQIEAEVAAARAVAVEKVQTDAANQAAEAAKRLGEQSAKEAARKAAQSEKEVADLERAAQAEGRLAAAVGQRWAVQRQAQIDNARAAAEVKYGAGPLADRATAAATYKIDEGQLRVQADFVAQIDKQISDIQSKGTARSFGDTAAESFTMAARAADQLGLSVAALQPRYKALLDAQQTEKLRGIAGQIDPTAAYETQARALAELTARKSEFGVSDDALTQAALANDLARLSSSREWSDGAEAAFRRYANDASNYGQGVGSVISSGLSRAESALNAFSNTNQTVWERARSVIVGVLSDINQQFLRSQVTGPLAKILGEGAGSWFSGGESSSSTSTSAATSWVEDPTIGWVPQAKGGVWNTPGLSAYSGTIVNSPTIFPFARGVGLMGEAGPEAILPLQRASNGKLGVQASGGSSSSSVILHPGAITINAPGATAEDAHAIAMAVAQQVVAAASPHIASQGAQQALAAVQYGANRGGSFAQNVGRRTA